MSGVDELSPHRLGLFDELDRLANTHIESSLGKLTLLDRDPSQLDYRLEGTPLDTSFIDVAATAADSRFPFIQQEFSDVTEEDSHVISFVGEILKRGDNVIMATNHGELTDVALVFASFCSQFGKTKYGDMLKSPVKRGIIVSQIVSRIGLNIDPRGKPLPATEALKLICDDVWQSFPITSSTSIMRSLLPDVTRAHNRNLGRSIMGKLDHGGYLLAMAPSGSKDRPLPGRPDSCGLQPLTSGTIKMMRHPKTYTLFTGAWLGGETPFVGFSGIPRKIISPDDAHEAMKELSETLDNGVPGREFVYRRGE